jgi:hypothetical protein
MARTDVYLKVVVEHGEDERVERLAAELCRQLLKLYGVRSAEVQNVVARSDE